MMGVPTEHREETDPPDDAKASESASPPEGDSDSAHAFLDDGTVRPSEAGTGLVHKDSAVLLDENANEDFKVERLQLNELTEADGGQDAQKPAARGKEKVTSVSDEHDIMKGHVTNGDDLLTPRDGEQTEREEGEEEEEEEEPPEMTAEERKDMYEAVKAGDIDLLEDLLEKPNSDINMVYFGDNLLVTALRADQQEMAEFLLDNGVDQNYASALMHMGSHGSTGKSSHKKSSLELFRYSCRQMAYDKGFLDIVEIIDILNGRLFPGVKPRERIPRYRRPPPPTPSHSSTTFTDSDSSSVSSGDESDISGATRSSTGAVEDTGRGPEESSWTMSTSGDREGSLLSVPERTKKTKKTKKKTKKAKNVDGVDGEDPLSEKDSVIPDSRKTKSRRRGVEEGEGAGVEEKDTASSRGEEDGGGGSSSRSRRSGASRGEGGNLTDRSKATTKSSERSKEEEAGEMGVNDEGYETMSPSPSHPLGARGYQQQQQSSRFQQPPSIPVKPTKAFLALRRTNDTHKQHCIPAKYNEARPLQWRKVRSTGSYHVESPLWHQHSSPQSPKLPPPTPAGTPTTVCMLSPRSGLQSRANTCTSLVSTVELSVGDVTKPKILQPSHRVSSGKSSITAVSSSVSIGGATSSSTSLSSSALSADPRLYPLQLKVPSYMRMTTSCFVKRRLEPNFTTTYSSLDFVEPGPTPFHGVRGPGDPAAKNSCWGSGEDSGGLLRKSASPALSGRSGSSGLPSVLDKSPSASPSMSRKKGYRVVGVDREHTEDMVPNIRNNSSVLQTSKLNAVSTKVR